MSETEWGHKPARLAIEFWEDRNGALILKLWKDNKEVEDHLLWSDFVDYPEFQDVINRMYIYIQAKFDFLLEKRFDTQNLHDDEVVWRIRRFISKYMAGYDKDYWDWIEYTDGTYEMHLDSLTCAQQCPIIEWNIRQMQESRFMNPHSFEANNHAENHILSIERVR